MKNQYLISVVDCSKIYSIPRDKLYAAIRSGNSVLPFVRIGNTTKINVPMLEKLLDEKSILHEKIL